jgi:4-diphosphocytidyl-2-C-methyl-D-erythritol kinase
VAPSLLLRAPAKINPVLEVLGQRPDGYHELALVFQAVALYDELAFEKGGEGVRLSVQESPFPLAADDSNLVVKAARLFLAEVLGGKGGVSIRLRKKIPVAAGLGGGSSDAAATLWGLDRLFQAGLGEERLQDLAARLGSDVPFFLKGGTALGRGRGEKITTWPASPGIPLVLVKPPEGLSTPAVYQSGKALFTSGERARDFQKLLRTKDLRKMADSLFNGLEPAAFFLMPPAEKIKKRLLQAGALGALVSGSGPAVFAIAETPARAEKIASQMEGGGNTVIVTKTVPTGILEN